MNELETANAALKTAAKNNTNPAAEAPIAAAVAEVEKAQEEVASAPAVNMGGRRKTRRNHKGKKARKTHKGKKSQKGGKKSKKSQKGGKKSKKHAKKSKKHAKKTRRHSRK